MQEKNLNIIPSGDMPVIYASQYDKNRVIRFNLFEGEDEYTLAGTEIVKCNIRKNDEHIVVITPTIGANKYIDVYLTEQACACFGDNIGEITISSGEDNIIGTINFILKVERNPIQGGVTSASDIADLESQIEDIVHEVMTDDYYTRDEVDAKLDLKANASDVYTKSQVDTALGLKADKADTYTKSQVDTALASKADASSVYTKSEVDTALALKANASDVYTKTEVDEIIDDLYPVNTASGSIANFTTSLVRPLTVLSSTIVAQQAGTGTPSPQNVRSISGVSSVKFRHTEKSTVVANVVGEYVSENGVITQTSAAFPYKSVIARVEQGETYTYSVNGVATVIPVFAFFTSYPDIGMVSYNNERAVRGDATFIAPIDGFIFIRGNADFDEVNQMVSKGSTVTAYEDGNTFTIQLGQTVYGGVLDAKNGKLTITHELKKCVWSDGTNATNLGSNTRKIFELVSSGYAKYPPTDVSKEICDKAPYLVNFAQDSNHFYVNANNVVLFMPNDTPSTEEINVVFELATPVEIDITANNFTTFAGEQNIFSDCGEVTVGFKQGIQEYIDSKIGG